MCTLTPWWVNRQLFVSSFTISTQKVRIYPYFVHSFFPLHQKWPKYIKKKAENFKLPDSRISLMHLTLFVFYLDVLLLLYPFPRETLNRKAVCFYGQTSTWNNQIHDIGTDLFLEKYFLKWHLEHTDTMNGTQICADTIWTPMWGQWTN